MSYFNYFYFVTYLLNYSKYVLYDYQKAKKNQPADVFQTVTIVSDLVVVIVLYALLNKFINK